MCEVERARYSPGRPAHSEPSEMPRIVTGGVSPRAVLTWQRSPKHAHFQVGYLAPRSPLQPPPLIHPVPLVGGEGTSGGTLQMPPVTPATEVTPQESTSCSRPGPTWVSPVPGVVVHRMLPGPRSFPSCSPSFRSGAPESSASIGRAGRNTGEQRSIEGGLQGRDGVGSHHFRPHPAPGTQSHGHR